MTQTVPPEQVTRIFTFGYGHTCPHTGKDLGDHYVTITAPDMSAARLLMIAVFGKAWCTDYSGVDDPRLRGHGPRMVEHGRFVIGVPVPVDRGMAYSRDADETPVGAREPLYTGGVVDGGQLVEHFEARGWKGDEPGSCGVECACGTGFNGFDSLAEAAALLALHIEDPQAPVEQIAQRVAVEAAHVAALDEDNERAKTAVLAGMRFEDAGRIPNPNLARFLAHREDAARAAADTVPVPAEDATLTQLPDPGSAGRAAWLERAKQSYA